MILWLVTVCCPAKAFIFDSGHPDVCTAIIMIMIIVIIIIIIMIIIKIIIIIVIIMSFNKDEHITFRY